jgi:hypothetical protein
MNGLLPENGSFVHVNLSSKIFGSLLVEELLGGRRTAADIHSRQPQVYSNGNMGSLATA